MKVVYPLGMLALVGAVFLALGALSASARTGGLTPAETHANAMPEAAPPVGSPAQVPPSAVLPITPIDGARGANPAPGTDDGTPVLEQGGVSPIPPDSAASGGLASTTAPIAWIPVQPVPSTGGSA